MTVLTNAVAASIPGRLAPYRYDIAPSPVDVYLDATAGIEALFTEISGDYFRNLETRTRNTDAPRERTEYLLGKLDVWKKAIDRFDDTVTGADFAKIRHLPDTDSRRIGYLAANTAIDRWLACRKKLHAAFIDWSFDLTGTVDVPEPAGPAPVIVAEGHRVPGCTGHCAADGCCSAELGSINVDETAELVIELYADEGDQPTGVVYTFDAHHDGTLLRTSNPAELRRKADEFYQFAGRIDQAAYVLDQLQKREAK
ncbi:hypothetical protein [Streptomyces ardesiacus]|uniref:Uncharacterized protein n=1 Tax=Streptomyces ardesiacus TaxID=285564 RepID=A0ABW8H8U5_9ACTN